LGIVLKYIFSVKRVLLVPVVSKEHPETRDTKEIRYCTDYN